MSRGSDSSGGNVEPKNGTFHALVAMECPVWPAVLINYVEAAYSFSSLYLLLIASRRRLTSFG